MKENSNATDTNVATIEEDIKLLEEMKKNCFSKRDYIDVKAERKGKAIEHILSDYKRILKENEELKADNYELNNIINDLLETIPIQKVKDKIEEIQEEGYWLFTTDRDSDTCVEVLQELIEEREENKC